MLRRKIADLLDRQSKELKRLGIYTALVLLLFSLCFPLLGRRVIEKSENNKDVQIPVVTDSFDFLLEETEDAPLKVDAENTLETTVDKPAESDLIQEKEKAIVAKPIEMDDMIWPMKGELVREYGVSYSPTFGDYRFHDGLDIKADRGTELFAILPGTVVSIEQSKGSGTIVTIQHGTEWQSRYSHVSQLYIMEGSEVKAGQVLGSIGQPGYYEINEGSHLHFTLLYNQQAVNPLEHLPEQ